MNGPLPCLLNRHSYAKTLSFFISRPGLAHLFNCVGIAFEYFGACYKEIMYYLSTNPNTTVVKHFLDEGKKNRIIGNSKIPNQHFMSSHTRKLQGHSIIDFCARYH